MKIKILIMVLIGLGIIAVYWFRTKDTDTQFAKDAASKQYWFLLHRTANKEYLYHGIPGKTGKSTLVKAFTVKTGIPGKKPTPLPGLAGREYWNIIAKTEVPDNPETSPYFLTLDVPAGNMAPYGPAPYTECGGQCDWQLPGSFGLHGTGGDPTKLAKENEGSSGCIRHSDEDITYLYRLLNPTKNPIRYYIKDI